MNSRLKAGNKFPDFAASSTDGLINLSDYAGKWVILFCNPNAFDLRQKNDWATLLKYHKEFSKRNVSLIGISMDKNAAHLQWLYSVYRGKINHLPFPIIDDRKGQMKELLNLNVSDTAAANSSAMHTFILAPDQTLAASSNYSALNVSRINDLLNKLDALQSTYRNYPQSTSKKTSKCNVKPIVGEYVLGSPANVDPSLLDFVIYAFAQIKPDGSLEVYSTRHLQELVNLKNNNSKLKVIMAIGGWGSEGYSDAALTPTSRYAFAREAKRWVDRYGLDGIDLDWEYPGNSIAGIKSRPEDKENFTLLITALRDVLGDNKWISVAGTGDPLYIRNVEINKIAPLINHFNLMAYDFNGGETGETAGRHQSNLFSSNLSLGNNSVDFQVENLIKAGMPSSKILMGIPFYGRYGATSTKTFDELRRNYININGYTVRWDDAAKVPYIVDASGNFVYAFDNPASIYYKGKYVEDNCLGGLFSWQSGMDNANILASAMSQAVRDPDSLRQLLINEYSFTP